MASYGDRALSRSPLISSSPEAGSMVARQHLEELVLTLSFEGGQAEDLTLVQLERDTVDLVAEVEVLGLEDHRSRLGRSRLTFS